MSLVGTRPPTVDEWEQYELHHRSRMSTKPGITGMRWMMSNQYTMKIYPAGRGRDVYRNIEICGNSTLNQLCQIILEAFDFIDEHLYEFCMCTIKRVENIIL